MAPKTLLITSLALALLALIIYILYTAPPRGGAGVVITQEECRESYPHWAPQSTRSYALQYDKDTVNTGEPVHVKLWVFAPQAPTQRDTLTIQINSHTINIPVTLKPRAMYLEACLAITPHTPGHLKIKWRNMETTITVNP